jgi:hypothetical protein
MARPYGNIFPHDAQDALEDHALTSTYYPHNIPAATRMAPGYRRKLIVNRVGGLLASRLGVAHSIVFPTEMRDSRQSPALSHEMMQWIGLQDEALVMFLRYLQGRVLQPNVTAAHEVPVGYRGGLATNYTSPATFGRVSGTIFRMVRLSQNVMGVPRRRAAVKSAPPVQHEMFQTPQGILGALRQLTASLTNGSVQYFTTSNAFIANLMDPDAPRNYEIKCVRPNNAWVKYTLSLEP